MTEHTEAFSGTSNTHM